MTGPFIKHKSERVEREVVKPLALAILEYSNAPPSYTVYLLFTAFICPTDEVFCTLILLKAIGNSTGTSSYCILTLQLEISFLKLIIRVKLGNLPYESILSHCFTRSGGGGRGVLNLFAGFTYSRRL